MPGPTMSLPRQAAAGVPAQAPTNPALGRAIRRLRTARHLSIEDLALAARMHPTYLSGIERGERNPTWRKLADLAQALDVAVSSIAAEAEREHSCPACGTPVGPSARSCAST
jgi:ribosome-binding protein aMBF1 (putative translation factor)